MEASSLPSAIIISCGRGIIQCVLILIQSTVEKSENFHFEQFQIRKKKIIDAIKEIEEKTCVRFVQKDGHGDCVDIMKKHGCASFVGKQGVLYLGIHVYFKHVPYATSFE